MKITRPLWAKGVFTTPQHFQQQAMWTQFADERIARMISADPWGLSRVVFDQQALGVNRLQLNAIDVRLPDGTFIDSETVDRLPVATRRVIARVGATQQVLRKIDGALSGLPADIKRNTPLVLVVGTTSTLVASAFGNEAIRVTETAIWVRVSDPSRLAHFADSLKRWRDGQGPDAVACLIDADAANDQATLIGGLRRWRSAIDEAGRSVGYA